MSYSVDPRVLDGHIRHCVEELSVGKKRLLNLAVAVATARQHKRDAAAVHMGTEVLQDMFGRNYRRIIDPLFPFKGNHKPKRPTPGVSLPREAIWSTEEVLDAIKRTADSLGWTMVSADVDLILSGKKNDSEELRTESASPQTYTCSSDHHCPLFVTLNLDGRMTTAGRAVVVGLTRAGGESYRVDPKGGRRYCVGPGLMYASKETRRMALEGTGLVDLDMKRSFPTLLLHHMETTLGIPRRLFPVLQEYSSGAGNITPAEKEDANACMNGRVRPRTPLGSAVAQEMILVRKLLRSAGVPVDSRDWLHRLIAPLEDATLRVAEAAIAGLGRRVLSLVFDGLICEDLGPDGVSHLESAISAAFPGLSATWIVKETF